MKKTKMLIKVIIVIESVFLIVADCISYVYQGIIYGEYMDKSLDMQLSEYASNEIMTKGLYYKNIGVKFSEIGTVLFWLFWLTLVIYIILVFISKSKNRKNKINNK